MIVAIPTTYRDPSGNIETTILNDGETLSVELEGIRFTSRFFDDFVAPPAETLPDRFTLNEQQELTNCQMSCRIPLVLTRHGQEHTITLIMNLDLGTIPLVAQAAFGLSMNGQTLWANQVQLFEGGLDGLIGKLPAGYHLKCCYGCAFSDYSVYGQGFFGTMLCFRNIKESYLNVQDKDEYMEIMDQHDRFVQETYVCEEFQVRRKGTGYRC